MAKPGTNEGNAYAGGGFTQGRGFATVLGDSIGAAIRANQAAATSKGAAAAKAAADGAKMTEEKRPGATWHIFSNDYNKEVEDHLNGGAALQTARGIPNMWADTSPDAANWRNGFGTLNQRKANIDQAKEYYDKSLAKYEGNQNKYKPESVAKIKGMADVANYAAIADGSYEIPALEYKAPVTLMNDFFVREVDRFQKNLKEGEVVDFNDVMSDTNLYLTSPDNEANAEAAMQMYNELSADQKKIYRNSAHRAGMDPDKDAWKYFAGQNFYDRLTAKDYDMNKTISDIAAKAPYKKSSVQDMGVTISSKKVRDKTWADTEARTLVKGNPHLQYNDNVLASLGIDPKLFDPDQIEGEMIKRISDQVILSTDVEYGKAIDSNATYGGATEEEVDASYNEWRRRIGLLDNEVADEAAGFIQRGTFRGETVVSAQIIPMPPEGDPFRDLVNQSLLLDMKDKTVAIKLAESYFKEWEGQQDGSTPEKRAFIAHIRDQVNKEAESGKVFIPLTPGSEQVLKGIYQEEVKKRKSIYKPEVNDRVSNAWESIK